MADKPAFDPSQPFDVVKPPFDPSQPFDVAGAAASTPEGSSALGVAKSLGIGAAQGGIGLAGIPGDLAALAQHGASKLPDLPSPAPDSMLGRLAQFLKDESARSASLPAAQGSGDLPGSYMPPTSGQIQKSVEGVTGDFYKPQGAIEETAAKIGQFAPALIGGPETLATRALTRVAAPAAASEAAGKATEGTAAQPYAELAGALVGGAGASAAAQKFKAMAAARSATNAIPSAEDLLKSGSNGFEAVKASDAIIKPAAVEQMAKDIKTELLNDGKHPTSEGQAGVFNALDRLEAMGQSGGVTTKDMEVIRKNLVDQKTSLNPSAAKAARDATNSFMDKYSNLGQNDLLNGTNPFPILKNAIADYAAGKRSNTVMGKVALGNLNAETAGAGANTDNALRQAIKQLVRPVNNDIVPKAKRLGFNDAEVNAMNTAARGTLVGNTARYVGKAAPTGIVSAAMAGGAGHLAGGPIGAVALPVAGYIAKKIGDLSTKRAVAAVDSLVRSRSPLAAQVASSLPPTIIKQLSPKTQALLTGLLAADNTLKREPQPGYAESQPGTY